MKTKHLFIILLIALSLQGFAQDKKCGNYDKFKTEKVAFITTRIDLTVEEAQAFWAVYNEYDKKINDLIREEHDNNRDLRHNKESLSEKELEEKLDRIVEINQERANLMLEYHKKFKDILPVAKVSALYDAENDFKKELLHRYRKTPCKNDLD
jgi:hypothetical protein